MHLNKTQRVSLLLIVALLALYQAVSATPLLPVPRNMVNDSAHLYTPAEAERLETLLRNYRDTTGREIVVVTVNDFQGYDANAFATRLGNDWGVGQRGTDNGIIFLLRASQMPPCTLPQTVQEARAAWEKGTAGAERMRALPPLLDTIQRRANAYWRKRHPEGEYGEGYIATGRSVEAALPDVLAMRIMRDFVAPYAMAQRYAEGTEVGVYTIIAILAGDEASLSIVEPPSEIGELGGLMLLLLYALIVFVIAGYAIALLIVGFLSLGHLLHYWRSKELQQQYRLRQYWGRETKDSAKRVLRRVPSTLRSILAFILSSAIQSRGGNRSSGRGRYSGGGGSFGGGGGGSKF